MKTEEIEVGKRYYLGNTTSYTVDVVAVRETWKSFPSHKERHDGVLVRAVEVPWKSAGQEWVVKPRDIFRPVGVDDGEDES